MAPKRMIARLDDEEVRLEIQADGRVRLDARPDALFTVSRAAGGEYLVCVNERDDAADPARPNGVQPPPVGSGRRQWRAWVAGPPEARSVHVDGCVFELEIAPQGSRPRATRHVSEGMSAPMPATVVEVVVEVGQDVRQGDVLLKLEAMKMEMPLRAGRDGRVSAVRCAPGDLVQPGVQLVELE